MHSLRSPDRLLLVVTGRTFVTTWPVAVRNPIIMSALGVLVACAVAIRAGRRRPHPRHWKALAELVGVSAEGQ